MELTIRFLILYRYKQYCMCVSVLYNIIMVCINILHFILCLFAILLYYCFIFTCPAHHHACGLAVGIWCNCTLLHSVRGRGGQLLVFMSIQCVLKKKNTVHDSADNNNI